MQTTKFRIRLFVFMTFILAFVWARPLDVMAARNIESGFQRALVTFGAARAMNAVISVVKSASVETSAVVAGASVHPGAVLEPLSDLVDQFSSLMLAATVSFAIQAMMLKLMGTWPVTLLLTILIIYGGAFIWRGLVAPHWLRKATVGLFCMTVAVPMIALLSEISYQAVLAPSYVSAQAGIVIAPEESGAAVATMSLREKAQRWIAELGKLGEKAEALKAKAEGTVEHIIRLAAVFVIQTLVLPLLFLGAMMLVYASVTRKEGLVTRS